jgi:hypothetical protein
MRFVDDYRQDARQDLSHFKSLIKTPANLVTGFTLPANGVLFASTSSVVASPTVLITVGQRNLGVPAGAANRVQRYDGIERGKLVKKKVGAPGTVKVYVSDGFGNPILIAQG